MTRTKQFSIWIIALAELMIATSTVQAKDYDFKYNGLYYKTLSSKTVKVVPETKAYPQYTSGNRPKGAVTIPETVHNVGKIGKSYTVTEIGDQAFNECTGITSITLPKTIVKIGQWAFYQCKSLESISIPIRVKTIEKRAFMRCQGLKTVTVHWNTPLDVPDDVFYEVNTTNVTLKVPKGKEEAYKAHAVWGKFNVVETTANEVIDGLRIYAADGVLHLALPSPATVNVYSVSGAMVKTLALPAGDHVQPLPAGVYVVRVGERVTKVMVK